MDNYNSTWLFERAYKILNERHTKLKSAYDALDNEMILRIRSNNWRKRNGYPMRRGKFKRRLSKKQFEKMLGIKHKHSERF